MQEAHMIGQKRTRFSVSLLIAAALLLMGYSLFAPARAMAVVRHALSVFAASVLPSLALFSVCAKILVKAVFVDAFAADSAPEAAQTAALEGVFPQIENPGGIGQLTPEPGDHACQLGILRQKVGNDHHIAGLAVPVFFRNHNGGGDANRMEPRRNIGRFSKRNGAGFRR